MVIYHCHRNAQRNNSGELFLEIDLPSDNRKTVGFFYFITNSIKDVRNFAKILQEKHKKFFNVYMLSNNISHPER